MLCDYAAFSLLVVNGHKLILDFGQVVSLVDALDADVGLLNLGQSVDLDAHMLLDDVSVGVSNGDDAALGHDIELGILGNKDGAAVLVTNDALSRLVNGTFVSHSFTGDLDALNSEVHGNSSTWVKILHGDEGRLSQNDGFSCVSFAFHLFFAKIIVIKK